MIFFFIGNCCLFYILLNNNIDVLYMLLVINIDKEVGLFFNCICCSMFCKLVNVVFCKLFCFMFNLIRLFCVIKWIDVGVLNMYIINSFLLSGLYIKLLLVLVFFNILLICLI